MSPLVLLFQTDVLRFLAVFGLSVASAFPVLFLQPDDFAHDVYKLHGGVAAFADSVDAASLGRVEKEHSTVILPKLNDFLADSMDEEQDQN